MTEMFIVGLEMYDAATDILSDDEMEVFNRLRDGMQIDLNEIKIVIKLVLRELMWCKLWSSMRKIEVEFGYVCQKQ